MTAIGLPAKRSPRRRTVMLALGVSLAIHVGAAVLAGIYIVARYLTPPQAVFVAKKAVAIPPQVVEQKMAAAEYEAMAAQPVFDDHMASTRVTDFALPDLPKMPAEDMMPLDPGALISDSMTAMAGSAGSGAGGNLAGQGGMEGMGTSFSFFGIEGTGRSVVFVFDISRSVLNKAEKSGVPIAKIKEETMKLIESLSINTAFTLIQFSRNYQPFQTALVPPTEANRAAARKWLETQFRTDGYLPLSVRGAVNIQSRGMEGVLEAALALSPDVIFILSDGDFQKGMGTTEQISFDVLRDLVKQAEKSRPEPTQINFVGFLMKPEHKEEVSRLVHHTGGRLSEVDK